MSCRRTWSESRFTTPPFFHLINDVPSVASPTSLISQEGPRTCLESMFSVFSPDSCTTIHEIWAGLVISLSDYRWLGPGVALVYSHNVIRPESWQWPGCLVILIQLLLFSSGAEAVVWGWLELVPVFCCRLAASIVVLLTLTSVLGTTRFLSLGCSYSFAVLETHPCPHHVPSLAFASGVGHTVHLDRLTGNICWAWC